MRVIERSLVTNIMLDALQPTGDHLWVVGDHEKPPEGGWVDQPNHSDWVPYVILSSAPPVRMEGSMGSNNEQITLIYTVTAVTRVRETSENISGAIMENLNLVPKQTLSDGSSMGRVLLTQPGRPERLAVEPPLFLITDTYSVHTSKRC